MASKRKKEASTEPGVKNIAANRRASFDYELGERFEAGLVLTGSEVKSLRNASAHIAEAWANIVGGEAFLEGMKIPVLQHAAFGHKEDRSRKLLLHKKQIEQLKAEIERKGMTVVVTRLYFRDGRVKCELALAKGLRKGDKREAIRVREADREAKSAIARARRS